MLFKNNKKPPKDISQNLRKIRNFNRKIIRNKHNLTTEILKRSNLKKANKLKISKFKKINQTIILAFLIIIFERLLLKLILNSNILFPSSILDPKSNPLRKPIRNNNLINIPRPNNINPSTPKRQKAFHIALNRYKNSFLSSKNKE
jgi:hypothetical protein